MIFHFWSYGLNVNFIIQLKLLLKPNEIEFNSREFLCMRACEIDALLLLLLMLIHHITQLLHIYVIRSVVFDIMTHCLWTGASVRMRGSSEWWALSHSPDSTNRQKRMNLDVDHHVTNQYINLQL